MLTDYAMRVTMDWSIGGFLGGLKTSLITWGQALVIIVGLVMVVAGVIQVAKGLMSGGRAQTNWVVALALLFVGGMLAFSGGWAILKDIGTGAKSTLDTLGGGGEKTTTPSTSILIDAGSLSNSFNVGNYHVSFR